MSAWRRILMWAQALAVVVVGAYDLQTLKPWVGSGSYHVPEDRSVAVVLLALKTRTEFTVQVRLGQELLAHLDDPSAFARYVREFREQGARVRQDIEQLKAVSWLSADELQLLAELESAVAAYESCWQVGLESARTTPSTVQPHLSAMLQGQETAAAEAAKALVMKLAQRARAKQLV